MLTLSSKKSNNVNYAFAATAPNLCTNKFRFDRCSTDQTAILAVVSMLWEALLEPDKLGPRSAAFHTKHHTHVNVI